MCARCTGASISHRLADYPQRSAHGGEIALCPARPGSRRRAGSQRRGGREGELGRSCSFSTCLPCGSCARKHLRQPGRVSCSAGAAPAAPAGRVRCRRTPPGCGLTAGRRGRSRARCSARSRSPARLSAARPGRSSVIGGLPPAGLQEELRDGRPQIQRRGRRPAAQPGPLHPADHLGVQAQTGAEGEVAVVGPAEPDPAVRRSRSASRITPVPSVQSLGRPSARAKTLVEPPGTTASAGRSWRRGSCRRVMSR